MNAGSCTLWQPETVQCVCAVSTVSQAELEPSRGRQGPNCECECECDCDWAGPSKILQIPGWQFPHVQVIWQAYTLTKFASTQVLFCPHSPLSSLPSCPTLLKKCNPNKKKVQPGPLLLHWVGLWNWHIMYMIVFFSLLFFFASHIIVWHWFIHYLVTYWHLWCLN